MTNSISKMPINDQISEIMALAGVPSSERDRARCNFEKLPDADLSRRLAALRDGESRLRSWRERRPRLQTVAEQLDASSLTGGLEEPAASVVGALGGADAAHSELDRLRDHILAVRDVTVATADEPGGLCKLWSHWLHEVETRSASADDLLAHVNGLELSEERVCLAMAQLLEWRRGVVHPVLRSNRVGWTDVVSAIARLENTVDSLQPDLLIGVNDEGLSIAQTIENHMGLKVPVAVVRGSAETSLDWTGSPLSGAVHRVFMIGHLAWSGATLARALAEARDRYQPQDLFSGVLAARPEAVVKFPDQIAFHQLALGRSPELGIPFREVDIRDSEYTFGRRDDAGSSSFTITGDQLARARIDVGSSFSPVRKVF